MDLDAYFARIGHSGARKADLGTLATIVGHHASAIPFEALDVLTGKGIGIAPATVFDKLVTRGRGGYCFEQNGLLREVLTALGFRVEARLARVLWMRPADAVLLRPTHMVLTVAIDGRHYLADAGFGNGTPTAPLAFDLTEPQPTPLETFRLRPVPGGHRLDMHLGGDWAPVYEILAAAPAEDDLASANLFTSTHPDSRFLRDLMLARATADARFLLLGNRLTIRPARGESEIRMLDGPEELAATLRDVFGLDVGPGWRTLFERFAPPRR